MGECKTTFTKKMGLKQYKEKLVVEKKMRKNNDMGTNQTV